MQNDRKKDFIEIDFMEANINILKEIEMLDDFYHKVKVKIFQ